jgi:hypothetical protein
MSSTEGIVYCRARRGSRPTEHVHSNNDRFRFWRMASSHGHARVILHSLVLLCVAVIAAELTARLDDWWFHDIPFWSQPSYDDLFMVGPDGLRRGKPEAHFQKWQMNSFGFRNAEISLHPGRQIRRVILLGASETFGLRESPGKEFAAQLADRARPHAMEIVNAALPGITITTLKPYWERWVSRFDASTVIIYPSTHLFLSCDEWQDSPAPTAAPGQKRTARFRRLHLSDLRIFGRAMSMGIEPRFVVRWSNDRQTARIVAQHPPSWVYTAAPETCLTRFNRDLIELVDAIQRTGATVIVCTQALQASRHPGPEDMQELESFRIFSPRASARVIRDFVTRADALIRALPAIRHVRVVDVDRVLGGRHDAFGDLVHFNDQGASIVADLLLQSLIRAQGEDDDLQ